MLRQAGITPYYSCRVVISDRRNASGIHFTHALMVSSHPVSSPFQCRQLLMLTLSSPLLVCHTLGGRRRSSLFILIHLLHQSQKESLATLGIIIVQALTQPLRFCSLPPHHAAVTLAPTPLTTDMLALSTSSSLQTFQSTHSSFLFSTFQRLFSFAERQASLFFGMAVRSTLGGSVAR